MPFNSLTPKSQRMNYAYFMQILVHLLHSAEYISTSIKSNSKYIQHSKDGSWLYGLFPTDCLLLFRAQRPAIRPGACATRLSNAERCAPPFASTYDSCANGQRGWKECPGFGSAQRRLVRLAQCAACGRPARRCTPRRWSPFPADRHALLRPRWMQRR